MLPVLHSGPVLLVDDVLSTGTSIAAVLRLLQRAGVAPVAIAAAMLQGRLWRAACAETAPGVPVLGAFATPILTRDAGGAGGWRPEPG